MSKSQSCRLFNLVTTTSAILFSLPALAGTGPSSSQTPYLTPTSDLVQFTSILTTGDKVGGYAMVGIPDGLGAFDNKDGTITVLMNYELPNTSGVTRAHGGIGAFVSQWVIDKTTLQVLSGEDLIKKIYSYNSNSVGDYSQISGAALAFGRFCAGDLAEPTAYYNPATGLGTQARIFLNGEEIGGNGRGLANIANGSEKGNSYILSWASPAANTGGAWENLLANPFAQDKTVVIGNSDGGNAGLTVHVGNKSNTGNDAEKAGLIFGDNYRISVNANAAETRSADAGFGLVNRQANFALVSGVNTGTKFLRPEDGAWDLKNPNIYYFNTTDQMDAAKDGNLNPDIPANQVGRSRLWALDFKDITHPEQGGTINLLLDGTLADGKYQMLDNISANTDGTLTLLEDVGNNQHNGKVYLYDTITKSLSMIAQHDVARFGDIGITGSLTKDEETSGVIDITDVLGRKDGKLYSLIVDQNHAPSSDTALVEGGQLILITRDVPEPMLAPGISLLGLLALGWKRSRKG